MSFDDDPDDYEDFGWYEPDEDEPDDDDWYWDDDAIQPREEPDCYVCNDGGGRCCQPTRLDILRWRVRFRLRRVWNKLRRRRGVPVDDPWAPAAPSKPPAADPLHSAGRPRTRCTEGRPAQPRGDDLMGCDIHTHVECQTNDGTWTRVVGTPFDLRTYAVFGWLADVRNYSAVPPLAEPRGLPADASKDVLADWEWWQSDGHSCSWFTVDELAAFDYDAEVEDRRVTIGNDGGCTAEPGGGEMMTYREFLGADFFRGLDDLRALNDQRPTRVIFWFDS